MSKGFDEWYKGYSKKYDLDPNPDHPLHYYDYRSAFESGARPDKDGHMPSKFKKELHPNRYVMTDKGWTDTITDKPADITDTIKQLIKRRKKEKIDG